MKRFFYILSIALLCGALSCPSIDARGRNNGNNRGGTTQNSGNRAPERPNNNNPGQPAGRPGGNTSGRPGGNTPGVNQGNHNRPNSGGNSVGNRPGNRPGDNKPGLGNNPGYAPGHNPGPGYNPGPGHNPGPGYNPGPGHNNFGPGHNPGHGNHAWGHVPNYAPPRPDMRPPRPFYRPTPPPAYRPGPHAPIFRTILGVTIGTTVNLTLDYLFNNGYYITGYTNDAVYLNDVMQLNLLWPHATLFYERGRLRGSEFVYSSPYYDPSRYYDTYNRLLTAYGAPFATNSLAGGGMECTWFGYDGQYVTLQYVNAIANNGISRYYTTLSFGN